MCECSSDLTGRPKVIDNSWMSGLIKSKNVRAKVYEIKFVCTNPAFANVKAFYCVELYLNDQFEWISRFKEPVFKQRVGWTDDDYEQRQLNENCQIIFGINTSTNEIAFIQNNSCQHKCMGWGRRLPTEKEFQKTLMEDGSAFRKANRKIQEVNNEKMIFFENNYVFR